MNEVLVSFAVPNKELLKKFIPLNIIPLDGELIMLSSKWYRVLSQTKYFSSKEVYLAISLEEVEI